MDLCHLISRKWEMIAMKRLRKKSTIFELFLVSCLLLGPTITVTGLQNREVQFVTDAPIGASISNIYSDNTSTSNTSISIASMSNASASGTHNPETELPHVPIEVNDRNIESMINRYSPFVVDFWELGCRPCKSIDPTINEMALDFKGQIVFGKLCIDRNAASKKRYGISSTPTLLIFKDGTLIYRHVGNYPRQKLEEIILKALNTS
jgi:thioredoxin 1